MKKLLIHLMKRSIQEPPSEILLQNTGQRPYHIATHNVSDNHQFDMKISMLMQRLRANHPHIKLR